MSAAIGAPERWNAGTVTHLMNIKERRIAELVTQTVEDAGWSA